MGSRVPMQRKRRAFAARINDALKQSAGVLVARDDGRKLAAENIAFAGPRLRKNGSVRPGREEVSI